MFHVYLYWKLYIQLYHFRAQNTWFASHCIWNKILKLHLFSSPTSHFTTLFLEKPALFSFLKSVSPFPSQKILPKILFSSFSVWLTFTHPSNLITEVTSSQDPALPIESQWSLLTVSSLGTLQFSFLEFISGHHCVCVLLTILMSLASLI